MKIFLTGAAGFIGSHMGAALLDRGHAVTAIDSLNAYYDPALKQARLARLSGPQWIPFRAGRHADAAAFRLSRQRRWKKASRASSNGIAITTSSNVWTWKL